MRHRYFTSLAPLTLVLALSSACGSTSPSCKETETLYDLNQANPAGQTGSAFAQHAIGVHQVSLTRIQTPTEANRVTPAFPDQTPGTLTVSLAPGAHWSHVISEQVECSSSFGCNDLAVYCFDYFSVAVQVRLTAFNGTIDETFVGELVGPDPKDPDAATSPIGGLGKAKFELRREAGSFLGNFKVSPLALGPNETLESHEIILSASFQDGKLLTAELADETKSETAGGPDASVNLRLGRQINMTPR